MLTRRVATPCGKALFCACAEALRVAQTISASDVMAKSTLFIIKLSDSAVKFPSSIQQRAKKFHAHTQRAAKIAKYFLLCALCGPRHSLRETIYFLLNVSFDSCLPRGVSVVR